MLLLAPLLACRATSPSTDGPATPTDVPPAVAHSGDVHSAPSVPTTLPHSATASATADTGLAVDCSAGPPPGPRPFTSTTALHTEEDFDFDRTGLLLTQREGSLAGVTHDGAMSILVGSLGDDVRGIRTLPTGEVLVAQAGLGAVRRLDLATGTSVHVLGGLTFPNGLEVSSAGVAYVTEFADPDGRVREFDPITGSARVIGRLASPNNLALSPDERTLYVVTFGGGDVVALDLDARGDWGPPRVVYDGTELLGGVAVDRCGDVYVTEYRTGVVFRLRMPEATREVVAELPTMYGSFTAAHFSPGLGGWSTTELYVTNWLAFFAVDVGVEGRHVLR